MKQPGSAPEALKPESRALKPKISYETADGPQSRKPRNPPSFLFAEQAERIREFI